MSNLKLQEVAHVWNLLHIMANNIISWSLCEFAKSYKSVKYANFTHVDESTGEEREFASLVFLDAEGNKTFASFSSKMGDLSLAEVVAQKNDLDVCQLESGSYKVCRRAANAWQDVNLL